MARGKVNVVVLRALLLALCCWSAVLHAQQPTTSFRVLAGERLSDWLLRRPYDPLAYPAGLNWQVPGERDGQARLKYRLIALLATTEKAPLDSRQRLSRMIAAMPVTGRVPIALADPRWLQAHPTADPVLAADQVLTLPHRPGTVTVFSDDGKHCSLPHRPGSQARAYLSACQPAPIDQVDVAWVVQPDGTVRHFGIAQWNEQAQDEPAPGAMIWGPARDSGWSAAFSSLLADFLATQGIDSRASAASTERPEFTPPVPATPDTRNARAQDPMFTANDWGYIGLMQTPTARMEKSGEARFQYSRVYPYGRSSMIFQPLDWLEAGFRYSNISNRLYGPAELSGSQAYKDKSVDFKLRLTEETASRPQVAFGIIDVGGTGLFSSEYLVASKRSNNFDWSLGIGWGYLGGSGNIRNPFSVFGKGFDSRLVETQVGQAGSINSTSFFHGRTALFGGVQYRTPWEQLLLKAEYDGNSYQHEPQENNQSRASPFNIGLVYRYTPSIDFSAGLERGNTLMVGLTLHTRLDKLGTPKVSDSPMPQVVTDRPTSDPIWARTVGDIGALARWSVRQISRRGGELRVTIDDANGAYWNERIERVAAVLHRDAPADINRFVLIFSEQGVPMTERVIVREPWVTKHLRYQAMSERFEAIAAAEPRAAFSAQTLWTPPDERPFFLGLVPSYQQNLGGPDGFLLFRAGVAAVMNWRLSERTSISGAANLGLIDNYGKFKYDGPSNLPRVRTSLREYSTSSALTLPNLQLTHVGQLRHDQFYSVYGGILESMFAGVGGEWLYRPWHSPLAFGIDVNAVQQRGFKQDFTLRDYRVVTGHATAYWDTGWKSTQVKLSAGRYLARDLGVTLDLSRTFNNGVSIGAWATKTNVSAEEFGEGSFDKGLYVTIPFDAMMTSRSPAVANLVWSPLTRDGGAKLNRSPTLYSLTNPRSKLLTGFGPATPSPSSGSDDDGSPWVESRSIFGDLGDSTARFGKQLARRQTGSALLMGSGLVLASSLLDRAGDRWAVNHQGGRWDTLGTAANNIPLILGAGAGLFWMGLGGDAAAETAWSAIKAAAFTLGAETVAKYAVGRARPDQNLGPTDFSSRFSTQATNSSFPSIHMGVAFATVAPFAQQYDAPWLYAVAGLTAFGRIQQRQHFVSDVVAGGLIGYGIGSLMLDQQRSRRGAPRIALGSDRSIQASWDW